MPAWKTRDDLGRELVFLHPPERVVSLVPSDTYSVIALGAGDRLVGRTRYCEAAGVPEVGGTKDVDVDAVLALAPHLVIANQEENSRPALEVLAARVPVLVSLPRTVEQGLAHLARLARILGVGADIVRRAYDVGKPVPARATAFVPIWMDPLMTLNADTFGSDVLARAGIANAFGDRLRLYPLAADLGKTAPRDAAGRDQRYPRVTLDEVTARGADLIV
jgi:ABC-type Fe3+-hydroxamate transport system substrate-binding protein